MSDALPLTDEEDRDRLVRVLESSLEVSRSSQFFAWTQGPVYALLPHEILICGLAQGAEPALRLRYFSATRYFKESHFAAACNQRGGLLPSLISHWRQTREPFLVPSPPESPACDPSWPRLLQRLEMRDLAAHGLLKPDGEVLAWFGFCRVGDAGPRTTRILELLMPCMADTYARMLRHEAGAGSGNQRLGRLLTEREIQVLHLVRDGCTNTQIAERLGLSRLTAKNHVQNIRIKLKVKTRGQAASEGARLGLISTHRAKPGEDGDDAEPSA